MITVTYKNEQDVLVDSPLYLKLFDAHNRLLLKDPTIWGPDAIAEAAIRMDWIDLPNESRNLLTQLDSLFAKHKHLTNVILCGMGGSSLGPEVIANTCKKKLFILDSTDPNYLAHAIPQKLEETLVVVGSKSGSTVETASQKAFFENLFDDAGLNKIEHMVIVTDPQSPLDIACREAGFNVVNANPNVGGRFSVLGAFGLVPAALLGIDVSIILDSAADTKDSLISDPHPALLAAYAIITGTKQYFTITDEESLMPGLSDWVEQLVAESTGKNGEGRLPIVLSHADNFIDDTCLSVSFAGYSDLVISGDLGSQFIFWEWVTALIGAGLSIDPFNQPNVQESKLASGELLKKWGNSFPPLNNAGLDGSIAYFNESEDVTNLLMNFLKNINEDGYLAITAYLDRENDRKISELQNVLSKKIGKPVTFGWGPRFLHSTGQFHKGGQPNGSFLQLTGDTTEDFAIPGMDFSFKTLLMAQAIGDQNALTSKGLTTLRLHFTNRREGIDQLLEIAKKI
jgi:glucose-6-phosphate isomerase